LALGDKSRSERAFGKGEGGRGALAEAPLRVRHRIARVSPLSVPLSVLDIARRGFITWALQRHETRAFRPTASLSQRRDTLIERPTQT